MLFLRPIKNPAPEIFIKETDVELCLCVKFYNKSKELEETVLGFFDTHGVFQLCAVPSIDQQMLENYIAFENDYMKTEA